MAFAAFLVSSIAYAQHCLHGCPLGAAGQIIEREIYTLQNNAETKFSDWVAYRVTAATIDGPSRSRNWRQDPDIHPSQTMSPQDYTRANAVLGTDRGHQVPLASFSNTEHWATTNYLSNITPQAAALNQGPWARLEDAVRRLARAGHEVYVVTGPLYEWHFGTLPESDKRHTIPSGYFKVVALIGDEHPLVSSFVMEQSIARGENFCHFEVTTLSVEHRTGLDVMPELPPGVSHALFRELRMLSPKLGCSSI
ncbi:DNA/RNA non-specific endonuclease [Alkalimonas cellulosilytica]